MQRYDLCLWFLHNLNSSDQRCPCAGVTCSWCRVFQDWCGILWGIMGLVQGGVPGLVQGGVQDWCRVVSQDWQCLGAGVGVSWDWCRVSWRQLLLRERH